MLSWVVLAALAASDDVVLLRCLGATPERCADVTAHVRHQLSKHGGNADEVSARQHAIDLCAAERGCIAHALEGSRAWVSVDVAQVGDRVAIVLQAKTPAVANKETGFTVSALGYPAGVDDQVRRFIESLGPLALPDAPVRAELTPAEGATIEASSSKSHLPSIGLGIAGVAAIAGTVAFAIAGSDDAAALDKAKTTTLDGLPASSLTRSQAQSKAGSANNEFGLAVGCGVLTVALALAALWWELR